MVFLKLQPYVQSSLACHSCNKLSFKFFGPFKIIQHVGTVAYKLELPSSASIHNVFHVSQLKLSSGGQQVSPMLPSNAARLRVIGPWSRASSSGRTRRRRWPPRNLCYNSVNSFRKHQHGDTPVPKRRRMSAPRPHL